MSLLPRKAYEKFIIMTGKKVGCLCSLVSYIATFQLANVRNHLKVFFCHFNAFVFSFILNLVTVFLKCMSKKSDFAYFAIKC